MKRNLNRILAPLATGVVVVTAGTAHAQQDLEFAVPDVFLLVDSSGSMGLTSVRDPSNPTKYAQPQCGVYPATRPVDLNADTLGGTATPPDRWTMLVSVLTGTVQGLSCASQPRNAAAFRDEYALDTTTPGGGIAPYDYNYYLPYNRIIARQGLEKCTPAPSWDNSIRTQLQNNAVMWPAAGSGGPIYWRDIGQAYDANDVCSFPPQDTDGLIDQFQLMARFGLMTFDPSPHWLNGTVKSIGTGIVASSDPPTAFHPSGVGDTWSFFPNWMTDTSLVGTGWPGGCDEQTNALLEVGGRNPAAPPWEGRLIDFGDPMAGSDEIIRNNDRVQQALLAMRPYGATPIAGMLQDASHFLLNDNTDLKDAAGNTYFYGGALDPGVSHTPGEGCRQRFVILLTDGGPNMDLRPDCAYTINGVAGKCPYDPPEDSAQLLANNNIPVYVIGFAITAGSGSTGTCTDLLSNGSDPCSALDSCNDTSCTSGQCAYGYCINGPADETLAACCKIRGIASSGGTTPFFAEDFGSLYNAFTQILSGVVKGTRSRTQPIFATGNANFTDSTNATIAGARFLTSFETRPGDLFGGELERLRYKCVKPGPSDPPEAVLQTPKDPNQGDDFADNTDNNKNERRVYTVVAEPDSSGFIHSTRSVRPLYKETVGDGLGSVGIFAGDADSNMVSALAPSFDSQVDPRAMLPEGELCATNGSACCFATPSEPTPSAAACRTRFLRMQLGLATPNADIVFQRSSVFGPIMRTTPILVGPPQDYLRDESYTYYQQALRNRSTVIYAPTADGQLHAFEITRTNPDLNELWTFMPPAVLPRLADQFPDRYHASPQTLLDGPIIVRDVPGQAALGTDGRFLKRTRADAIDPTAGNVRWHSVLVGSFGSSPGYYALDVSWPDPNTAAPTGYVQGPRFLWQLTTDEDGQPLFGSRGAPPSIAMLYFRMPGETEPAEHAVALLPGGYGGERSDSTVNDVSFNTTNIPSVDSRLNVRIKTNAYTPTDASDQKVRELGGARSLTVVRLDTGEVIRTFRRGSYSSAPVATDREAPLGLYDQSRITPIPFDSPMTGHVVAYPNGSGRVSNRAYIGDAEGRFWRMDLSSVDPQDWNVVLFHDAFPMGGLTGVNFDEQDAAPIETPPILSTDPLGRVTIALSTGDQRTITSHGEYPVWSLTESLVGDVPTARVNWYLSNHNAADENGGPNHFANGERVTGNLTLFDSVLYFTTYDPSKENPLTCEAGESFLWAVHYVNAGTDASLPPNLTNPEVGPMPWLDPNPPDDDPGTPDTPSDASSFIRNESLGLESVAFGVGLSQAPACYETATVDPDAFLGFRAHNSITSVTPAKFQLVVQTGRVGQAQGTSTLTTTRNLYAPARSGRIVSWTVLLE